MSDLDTFRAETRAWLEANCPPEMREPMRVEERRLLGRPQLDLPDRRAAAAGSSVMAERGWTVPDWPKEYGGGGLSPAEAKVLKEEMARIGARPPLTSFGISMLGPALLKYRHRGAEEALPDRRSRAARSAGARAIPSRAPAPTSPACRPRPKTRATTGWSTARRSGPAMPTRPTGSSAWSAPSTESKHEGISFLLFDMETPGRLDQADPADLAATRPSARPSSTT